MTEQEWLKCETPATMFQFLRLGCTDRKLRLFCCACCSLMSATLDEKVYGSAADLGEKIVDGYVTQEQREGYEKELRTIWMNYGDAFAYLEYASELAYLTIQSQHPRGHLIATSAHEAAQQARREGTTEDAIELERLYLLQPLLLRDIFGNPFRPVALDPAWRTDTAVSLARQMYESREFSAMPILADALQDAGCENEDILTHCRNANQLHIRGCWIVDLVLGKE